MDTGSLLNTLVIVVLGGGISALFWARLNRIEDELKRKADKTELARLENRLDRMEEALRTEIAGLRSDITQIALAVGAKRGPQATGS